MNYYTEKLKSVADGNSATKSIYEDQLSRWQWKLKNPDSWGGIILGNNTGAGMTPVPGGIGMMGSQQQPASTVIPQPLPIPPQPR